MKWGSGSGDHSAAYDVRARRYLVLGWTVILSSSPSWIGQGSRGTMWGG